MVGYARVAKEATDGVLLRERLDGPAIRVRARLTLGASRHPGWPRAHSRSGGARLDASANVVDGVVGPDEAAIAAATTRATQETEPRNETCG